MKPLVAIAASVVVCLQLADAPEAPRWFKGNLRTLSLWNDGDGYRR